MIRILGKTYRLEEVTPKIMKNDEGICDYHNQLIKIADNLTPEERKDVILHEVIHAIDHLMDTGLSERQVQTLATGLMALFSDNPDFYGRFLS